MTTRFYLIPKKCHFLFGSQRIRPLRLAFVIKAQIRQKSHVSGSGLSLAWRHRAGLVGDASPRPRQSPAVVCRMSPEGDRSTPGAQGCNPPRGRAVRTGGDGGGSRGGTPALSQWPRQRLSRLLAFTGATVAPRQPATMRWKEEETALFCPKPCN